MFLSGIALKYDITTTYVVQCQITLSDIFAVYLST